MVTKYHSFIFYRSSDQYSWYSWWPKYATPEADRWLKWKVVMSIVYIPLKVKGQKFCPGMLCWHVGPVSFKQGWFVFFLLSGTFYIMIGWKVSKRFFFCHTSMLWNNWKNRIEISQLLTPVTGLGIKRILNFFKKSLSIFRFLNHSFLNYKLYECPPFARGLECLRPCSPESLGSV